MAECSNAPEHISILVDLGGVMHGAVKQVAVVYVDNVPGHRCTLPPGTRFLELTIFRFPLSAFSSQLFLHALARLATSLTLFSMESALIEWLGRTLPPHPLLKLGLGDDAAVLALGQGSDYLVTTDVITDHVDFKLAETTPQRIGRKALAVNLSDIAAMAGEPLAAVVGLVLPREGGFELAQGIFAGLFPLAEEYQVAIAGGDTNSWDGPLVVSVTLIGRATDRKPLRRDGARPGDKIIVTGNFGGSILGRHFDFTPRVREALLLNDRYQLHAGMDVSDGLSLDLSRLAKASGCGAQIELTKVPISNDARRLADQSGDVTTALDHALQDGEDFELLLAVPPDEARRMLDEQPLGVSLACIGEFVAERGLWQVDDRGQVAPLTPRGYQHQI